MPLSNSAGPVKSTAINCSVAPSVKRFTTATRNAKGRIGFPINPIVRKKVKKTG